MNRTAAFVLAAAFTVAGASAASPPQDARLHVKDVVDATVLPLMAKENVAGMAVGVVLDGRTYVFNYGVASRETQQPVGDTTLFEVGSVSKTFTATLTSYAQLSGDLSLSDPVAKFLPSLAGTKFGDGVTLLNLGTHTSGGLPLQVPDGIDNDDRLFTYLGKWQPPHAPGSYRTYSNISIGTLGVIVAKAMKRPFPELMDATLLPALGLTHTYVNLPADKMSAYAQGYKSDGTPIRMTRGELGDEAYGIRTTAGDLLRFVRENMSLVALDSRWQNAVIQTHTGYFRSGALTQDLIWEQYAYPVTLQTLLDGNSSEMLLESVKATAIVPPQPPSGNVWIDKTGSTNGFGTYVAFVPSKRMGIVMLSTKNYPIPERVTSAYNILRSLAE